LRLIFHNFSGGYVVGVTPVPIPNTEVKSYGADGTAWATVWESRSLPGLIQTLKARCIKPAGFSLFAASFSSRRFRVSSIITPSISRGGGMADAEDLDV
jgi:hypothetical protein